MVAGYTTLQILNREGVFEQIAATTAHLASELEAEAPRPASRRRVSAWAR